MNGLFRRKSYDAACLHDRRENDGEADGAGMARRLRQGAYEQEWTGGNIGVEGRGQVNVYRADTPASLVIAIYFRQSYNAKTTTSIIHVKDEPCV